MCDDEIMSSIATLVGPGGRTVVVEFESDVEAWPSDAGAEHWSVTDDQRAYTRELAAADLAEDLALAARADADGWTPAVPVDVEPVSADDVVESLSGRVHEMDLALLASFAPSELETERARIAHLQGLDRISSRVAAMRAEVLVELAGRVATGDVQVCRTGMPRPGRTCAAPTPSPPASSVESPPTGRSPGTDASRSS
jgi:hypothetical protein